MKDVALQGLVEQQYREQAHSCFLQCLIVFAVVRYYEQHQVGSDTPSQVEIDQSTVRI